MEQETVFNFLVQETAYLHTGQLSVLRIFLVIEGLFITVS
jgi:hypothetical protein